MLRNLNLSTTERGPIIFINMLRFFLFLKKMLQGSPFNIQFCRAPPSCQTRSYSKSSWMTGAICLACTVKSSFRYLSLLPGGIWRHCNRCTANILRYLSLLPGGIWRHCNRCTANDLVIPITDSPGAIWRHCNRWTANILRYISLPPGSICRHFNECTANNLSIRARVAAGRAWWNLGRVCLSECMLHLEVYGLSIYLVFLKQLRLFRMFLYTFCIFLYTFKTATQPEKFILSFHKKR